MAILLEKLTIALTALSVLLGQSNVALEPTPMLGAVSSSIVSLLENKTAIEKAGIKGDYFVQLKSIPKTQRKDYSIEITDIKKINGGIQFYVRAWDKQGNQIGFGKDGTVDLEKFIIINPPILVPDENGDIVRENIVSSVAVIATSTATTTATTTITQTKYREDLPEALLQSVEHTISIKKEKFGSERIIKGKIGNSTLTVYPDAAPGLTTNDGRVYLNYATSWAAWHDATQATGALNDDTNETIVQLQEQGTSYNGMRSGFGFDTSPINGATISASTFSLYGTDFAYYDTDNDNVAPVSFSPNSNTEWVVGDFLYTNFGTSVWATALDVTNWNQAGYNDFSLNATGLAGINKTGVTNIGFRAGKDISNTAPGDECVSLITGYYADQAGTTQDPKLVVEYTSVRRVMIISFLENLMSLLNRLI